MIKVPVAYPAGKNYTDRVQKRKGSFMNRKEILEIRNQFTPEKAAIDTLCGCYVDHEKKKRFVTRKAFGQLSAEEEFKYHDIFRHTLSGTIGKNLLSLAFPLEQEAQGGAQEFLLSLRDSKLQDDELLDQFFDRIIASYVYEANYYIIVIHGAYDIPSKATDGMEMFDASEDVYDFILLSICPVNLAKAGLSYNLSDNDIKERILLCGGSKRTQDKDIEKAIEYLKKYKETHK